MTTYTPNYHIAKYEGTDKPDLADQYGEAMDTIDNALHAEAVSIAENANSIQTLTLNLNSTNERVKTNEGNITSIQTVVDSLPENYASVEMLNDTNTRLAAVKTDVDKNTPLVEEHVNYFAILGVTDEQSATDLHTEIDNAMKASMSNTQSIDRIYEDISKRNNYDVVSLPTLNATNLSDSLFFAVNQTKTAIKLYGHMISNGAVSINRTLVPGSMEATGENLYGLKINYDTGLRPAKTRRISYVGIAHIPSTPPFDTEISYALGIDGYIYLSPSRRGENWSVENGYYANYLQETIFLDDGDWPTTPEPTYYNLKTRQ